MKKCCEEKGVFSTSEEWRLYVIVDHLRTFIFATADGALSGHKQHGYILKKLLKRSSLFAYMLGIARESLLVASERIIIDNASFYPFLLLKKDCILKYLDKELAKFLNGFRVSAVSVEKYLEVFRGEGVPAEKVFFWYDTEGIPVELIRLFLLKKGKTFDQEVFSNLLSKQKERSFSRREKVNIFNSPTVKNNE